MAEQNENGQLPIVHYVASANTALPSAPTLFTTRDTVAEGMAEGWLWVTDRALLLTVVVHTPTHVNNQPSQNIWDGDALQVAIDGLGDGAQLVPRDALDLRPDDVSYGFGLNREGAQRYVYHSGRLLAEGRGAMFGDGSTTDCVVDIVRDEAAAATTYRIQVPWHELGISAGESSTMGVAVLVNSMSGGAHHQYSWGTFSGGQFRPGLLQQLRIAWPESLATGAPRRAETVRADLAARPTVTSTVVPRVREVPRQLRDTLWQNPHALTRAELNRHVPEIGDIEVVNARGRAKARDTLTVVAWNCEFGRHWQEGVKLIREHPVLSQADIILLSEVDDGVARSGNQHVARLMAEALGMNYAFGVEFLELDSSGRADSSPDSLNARGYTGNAILSRFRLRDVRMVRFPQLSNVWYTRAMRRLGGRMALVAAVDMGGRRVRLVSTHFESNTSDPRQSVDIRAMEVRMLLEALGPSDTPVILGGDFNSRPGAAMFAQLEQGGFDMPAWNDTTAGSVMRKAGEAWTVGSTRIDYIIGRQLAPVRNEQSPLVVPAAAETPEGDICLSDHAIVAARVVLRP